MSIMACRYDSLRFALAGYEKTCLELIGYDGVRLFPSGLSDDIGTYYFVPKLTRLFDIPLEWAIDLFFYGIVFCAFTLGLIGLFLFSTSWLFRSIATVGLVFFLRFLSRCARGVSCAFVVDHCRGTISAFFCS